MRRKRYVRNLIVALLLGVTGALVVPQLSSAAPTATTHDRIELGRGESVSSPDGRYRLIHQRDGNVVLYGPSGAVWNTKTTGRDTAQLIFQGDGNLVLYGEGRALWHTSTGGKGDYLAVQNDSNLVVYAPDKPVWAIKGMAPPPSATHDYACGGDLPPCYVLKRESGGDLRVWNGGCYYGYGYSGSNPCGSTASGKWQFIRGTWNGYGGYLNAADAPAHVQNAKARELWAGGRGCSHWAAC